MTLLSSDGSSTVGAARRSPLQKVSPGRLLAYLLVISLGLLCGIVLAVIAGFSMGWITIQC